MTAFDRFDPFERRISDAIDEIADARPPAYLDNVFQQTARTLQRPRWTFAERWLPVTWAFDQPRAASFALLLLVAALIGLLGAAVWVASQPPSLDGPLGAIPAGTWETPHDGLSFGLPSGATREVLLIDPTLGPRSVGVTEDGFPGGMSVFGSSIVSVSRFEFELRTTSVTPLGGSGFEPGTPVFLNDRLFAGCELGDLGRYRWSLSSEGSVLTLQSLGDACPSREAVLGRTWTLVPATPTDEPSAP